MDHVHFTTTERKKGKRLSYDERILIQLRLKDNWSAKEIGCAPNTVRNEIRRGNVSLYHGNSLPRKILNYRTSDKVFEDELDRIYRRSAS